MAATFTHLHVHTQYSLLDGAARLKDMFAACKEMGMSHIAMTDHGNLHGAYDFFQQAKKAGVTPIIGIEAYVAPESRRNKRKIQWGQPHQKRDDVSGSGGYTHKTIWAAEPHGSAQPLPAVLRRLQGGLAARSGRGWTGRPSPSRSEGLIASTGCPSGEVQTRLRLGQFDEALKAASEYQDIFGKERYFLELMDHGIEIERRVRDGLLEIGKKLGIPPLVTNDSHYTYAARGGRARRAAVHPDRQEPLRPRPLPVRRHRLLPEVHRRDVRDRLLGRLAAGLRATRCWSPSRSTPPACSRRTT